MSVKKYLVPKFIFPALAVLALGAGYVAQSTALVVECYGAVNTEALLDELGDPFTRITGENCQVVSEVLPTATASSVPPTAIKTNTPPIGVTATKTNTPPIGASATPARATATKPASTGTPGATATKVSTPVPTLPGVTATPKPTQPGPITVGDDGCLVENRFHAVEVGTICRQYHTGANMRDPEIQKLFDTYAYPGLVNQILDTYGDLFQFDFVSSLSEVPHHYRGFKWLVDKNENCDQYESNNLDLSDWACVVYSANRIHDDGTVEHAFTRFHSAFFIVVVCGKNENKVWVGDISKENCGVRYGPQLMDFGEHHLKYKAEWNPLPGTDSLCFSFPSKPPDLLNGGLYRITTPEERPGKAPTGGWWAQPPNAVEKNCYIVNDKTLDTANAGIGITWFSTMWQIYKGEKLGFPIEDQKAFARTIPPSALGGNHTYTIINLKVQTQVPVPFNGWMDQWGNVKPDWECLDGITDICYPLVIVGNYPTVNGLSQKAIIQRRSNPASLVDCDLSPCLVYATPGTEVFPYFDNPTGEIVDHDH